MSVTVTIAGTSFAYPTEGEEGWASVASQWAVAVSTYLLQRTGGSFALTGEVDFGATFATKQAYIKSRTAGPASAGMVRLARADVVSWRNQAGDGNLSLAVDSSNRLTYNGNVIIPSTGVIQPTEGGTGLTSYSTGDTIYASASNVLSKLTIGTQNYVYVAGATIPAWALLVNANIDAAAAIAYSKLALTGAILDADINASAAIAFSKMAALTASKLLESSAGGVVGVATGTGYAKLASGAPSYAATIPRADVATGTNYRILANSSGGAMSENAAITAAHVMYADANGQIAGEATLATTRGGLNIASYTTGDLVYASSSSVISKLGIGSSGQRLIVSAGVPAWGSANAALATTTKTTTYPIVNTDDVIACDATTGGSSFTVTLPDCATNAGKVFYIKSTGTDFTKLVTVSRAGSDTIVDSGSAVTSTTLNTQGEEIMIASFGSTVWQILNRRIPSILVSWAPTIGGYGTGSGTATARWSRVGDSLYGTLAIVKDGSGGSGGANVSATLPTGLVIDTTKNPNARTLIGYGELNTAAAGILTLTSTSTSTVYFTFTGSSFGSAQLAGGCFKVPISGWNG